MDNKKALSAPFSKGVNFTGWLEYVTEEYIREDMYSRKNFEDVKSLGCDVVRLPIHFEKFCFADKGYVIPDKILRIMDNAVNWAEELGIYLILDFHNSTHLDSVTSEDVSDILFPVWEQIVNRYKNGHEYVIYELMNEPHGIEIPVWNDIILKLFEYVRGMDKEHYIIVGGADWNSFTGMKALPDFEDDRVIYTFHFYDPHTFTHQGANWCHMERVVGIPFPYDADKMPSPPADATEEELSKFKNYPFQGTLEEVTQFFDQYAHFSIDRNAPVYCGEFGCFAPFADPVERVNWYKIVTKLLAERNIARTSWDYYGPFGVFKRVERPTGPRSFIRVFPDDLDMDIINALGLGF